MPSFLAIKPAFCLRQKQVHNEQASLVKYSHHATAPILSSRLLKSHVLNDSIIACMRKFFLPYLCLLFVTSNSFGQALKFNGTNNYVNLTNDGSLNSKSFTLQAWIKPEGTGITATTGSDGVTAMPIITKGRAESGDPDYYRINYFLGLNNNKKAGVKAKLYKPVEIW